MPEIDLDTDTVEEVERAGRHLLALCGQIPRAAASDWLPRAATEFRVQLAELTECLSTDQRASVVYVEADTVREAIRAGRELLVFCDKVPSTSTPEGFQRAATNAKVLLAELAAQLEVNER